MLWLGKAIINLYERLSCLSRIEIVTVFGYLRYTK